MSSQGKFMQRLAQLEAENKLLRTEMDELKKWKTTLKLCVMDAFGLNRSDFKVDMEDVESVGHNDSPDTNRRCSTPAPTPPTLISEGTRTPPAFSAVPVPTSAYVPPPVKKIKVEEPLRPRPRPSPPRPIQIQKQYELLLSPVLNPPRLTESSDEDDEFPPTPPPKRSSASTSTRNQKSSSHSIQSTLNDYDKIPNPQMKEPKFAYKSEKPVRKKEERKKLPGWDCPTCRNYYEAMASQMEPGELEKLKNKCSKHRSKLPEPDYLENTPRYYWAMDFPSTQECLDTGLIKIGERSQRKARPMDTSPGPTLHLEIPFNKSEEALIAYNTLRVDKEPKRSQVIKTISVADNKLIVDMSSPDTRQLKHSSVTFFDHLSLVQQTIKAFPLPSNKN